MKLITCTVCNCTATVEEDDTLPIDWCEVDISNKTRDDFTGVLCEECKMKLIDAIIEKGGYISYFDFGDPNTTTEIKNPSKPIIMRYPK